MRLLEERFPPLEHYREEYAGLPLAWMYHAACEPLDDPAQVAWVLTTHGLGGGASGFDRVLEEFAERVDTTRVRALVIGEWDDMIERSSETVVRELVARAHRFPSLRALFLGDVPSETCEISWIRHGDVTPLLEAFPELVRLDVRGSSGLVVRPVSHARLRVLRLESGGLPGHVVRALGECSLPRLEHLELWLGVHEYGGDAMVEDLAGVLGGERLPALRSLGLRDSEIQDEVAAAVARAPAVARLGALSLSYGTLSDAGAEALLSGQPLTHLAELDLRHHYLSAGMVERLLAALPDTLVDVSEEAPRWDWRPGGRYVAVSE
ncbi:STM4015 family protein [Thermoactinospora rubra]|uniref:STM4015 family protein n=1 Tax=Thermoactinospora rubra TaxID=1088767 RepID=UPI00117EECD2|nr:STM4015 family protein [Thermoactinospora rubra]